jgi:hypothetical protein
MRRQFGATQSNWTYLSEFCTVQSIQNASMEFQQAPEASFILTGKLVSLSNNYGSCKPELNARED